MEFGIMDLGETFQDGVQNPRWLVEYSPTGDWSRTIFHDTRLYYSWRAVMDYIYTHLQKVKK
jgi:hypothetical protein